MEKNMYKRRPPWDRVRRARFGRSSFMSNATVCVDPFRRILTISLLGAMASSGVLLAQESRATLTGTVADPQGAAVPHASVIAKNLATNGEIKTETDAAGLYVLPFLD